MLKNLKTQAIPAAAAAGAGFFLPMISGMLPAKWNRPISLAVLGVLCLWLGRKKPILIPVGYALIALAAASQARGGNMAGPGQIKVLTPTVLGNMRDRMGRSAPVMQRPATMSVPVAARTSVNTR
jgi:hypothetical protein